MAIELGRVGIWIGGVAGRRPGAGRRAAGATNTIAVATGIVNIWKDDAETVAASYHRLAAEHPGRFLLGVGVGHREAAPGYRRPYDAVVAYLDRLDQLDVPADRLAGYRALAAGGVPAR